MIEWLVAGGPVMIPIAVASVVGLAAFFERMWSLRRERVVPPSFCVEVIDLVRQERWSDATIACRKRDVAIARILEVALDARTEERAWLKERVEEVGRRESADLERYIGVLGTVAAIAPLLGLLGTVAGMILVFESIATGGIGQMEALAGGISQALITTFAGLVVAIPAVIGNRYLLGRVDDLVLDLEEVSLGVVNLLTAEHETQKAAK